LPARSGLGSSSAFTVGLISALHALGGRYVSKDALASEAIHVEHCMLREPVGLQDQISAAFGGFNHITFNRDGTHEVRPMILPRDRLEALQDHLFLVFTGKSRLVPQVAQTVIRNLNARVDDLRTMQQQVDEAVSILSSRTTDITEFGRLLNDAWKLKRKLSDCVSTPEVDDLYDAVMRAGAIGAKLLGAGGGGFMLLFARPEDRGRIRSVLASRIAVPFKFESSGSRIVLYQPDGL